MKRLELPASGTVSDSGVAGGAQLGERIRGNSGCSDGCAGRNPRRVATGQERCVTYSKSIASLPPRGRTIRSQIAEIDSPQLPANAQVAAVIGHQDNRRSLLVAGSAVVAPWSNSKDVLRIGLFCPTPMVRNVAGKTCRCRAAFSKSAVTRVQALLAMEVPAG